jgi:DNA ligase-4
LCVQVKAAEIVETDQFATGYTMRFPRVDKIRYDKPWYDSMTLEELNDIRQKGKLTMRHAALGDGDDEPEKKKRRLAKKSVRPTIMSRFRGLDSASVVKVSAGTLVDLIWPVIRFCTFGSLC